ncbi:hypothetical protein [Streptomyces cahuitamycinicus]|uniref:hypothetical protein n=1 Tax=Streptomyces cahuitamycinicus TaxID=2070367 RepID=UPI0011AFA01D|nr:hypothetical protein [Streptomyces cahuitamycinicus]
MALLLSVVTMTTWWAPQAATQLRHLHERFPATAQDIITVAVHHLPQSTDPNYLNDQDNGYVNGSRVRRGITPANRAAINAGVYGYEDDPHASWNYLILYMPIEYTEYRQAGISQGDPCVLQIVHLFDLKGRRLRGLYE